MTVHYSDDAVVLHHGDCLDVLRGMADASVDAVVTDPPYGLAEHSRGNIEKAMLAWLTGDREHVPDGKGFMGRSWDAFVPPPAVWDECYRVLKPGGHLLAFAGSRTHDLMALSIRLAGFEKRDSIAWVYASGFPKSLDVSKAIDKARHDRSDVLRATAWIATRATPKALDAAAGTNGMGGHWTTQGSQAAVPTTEAWGRIAPLLGKAPEWLLALIKPARQPGEAWDAREIVGRAAGAANGSVVGLGSAPSMATEYDLTTPATDAARQWQGWGTALKPAHEPVVCARKPFSPVPYEGQVATVHHLLGALLWLSLSPAKRAELASTSRHPERGAGWCVSARVHAATATSPDASAATATYSSQALASTCSNIASSWSAILAALSDQTSTSTTSTRSSTTTALRTLSSLLAPVTSPTTMPACGCLPCGLSSPAASAVPSSSDDWSTWLHTLSASAPASAIDGIALAAASVLAQVAESLSVGPEVASSATPTATTEVAAGRNAHEPIVVARKPIQGTVAANVTTHGTGALNVDGCRVGMADSEYSRLTDWHAKYGGTKYADGDTYAKGMGDIQPPHTAGRWPSNLVLTHSGTCRPEGSPDGGLWVCVDGCPVRELDRQSGVTNGRVGMTQHGSGTNSIYGNFARTEASTRQDGVADTGGASRFFPTFRYEPKASTAERPRVKAASNEERVGGQTTTRCTACGKQRVNVEGSYCVCPEPQFVREHSEYVAHPTVKPLDLMRWLVRLVTPPDGLILDPFAGSGTTAEAAVLEGFHCVTIEREEAYLPLIVQRLSKPLQPDLFGGAA